MRPPKPYPSSPMARRRPPLLLLFLLVAAAVALSALPRTANSQPTDPVDVAAMQALSTALGADETLGWSKATDPCGGNWPHVACFAGRVTRIQIGNQSLAGTIPADIANLTALEVFELMSNKISGPLPSLSGLSALQRILFHHNGFTSIPASFFSGLTALQNVTLDHNPFAPWRIPDDLKAATSLVGFFASNASVVGPIPDFLATDFPGLIALSLSYNSLSGGIPRSFAGSAIRSLWLNGIAPGTGLSGGIEVIGNMTSLTQLWLQSNAFTGPLPDFSGLTSLNDLDLRDNRLTGPVPKSLTSLKSLQSVTLTNNLLQGPVPQFDEKVKLDLNPSSESFCRTDTGDCDIFVNVLISIASSFGYPIKLAANWKGNNTCSSWLGITCDARGNITVVNFSNMRLNGTISPDFAKLTALQTLVLSGNNLTGTIPSSLVSLNHLKVLDVSNNALWGPVPSFNKDVKVNTDGNPNIGKVVDPPIPSPGEPEKGNDTGSHSNPGSPADNGKDDGKSSASKVVVGCVIGGICGVLLISSLCFCYRRRIRHIFGGRQSVKATVIHPQHSGSETETVKISLTSGLKGGKGSGSEVYSLTSSGTGDHLQVGDSRNLVISIQVLRNATDNFREDNILGRGGFGTVYKGCLLDGTLVAVKRMESGVMGSKGLQEFKSEIDVLTKVRHRHLVSLLGYCLDENEKILVYEYMPMGTLSHHLFHWMNVGVEPLTWKRRLSIALDVARGVEYLHSMAHQSFIHRDLKPSNILLGDDMKAKVADFGLVRHAPDGKNCSVQTRIAGTFGYLAPEYAVTGRVTTKADLYSFGVILMELITGRKALDENQAEESMHLVTWFRRMLISKESFRRAIDPSIEFDEDEETLVSISTVAELAGYCCSREPYQRPDMGHAVNVLSSLAELWRPNRPIDNMDDDNSGIDIMRPLPQMLKEWQALENSQSDSYTQSFLHSNTQGSIPTRPVAFAESFTSADGR